MEVNSKNKITLEKYYNGPTQRDACMCNSMSWSLTSFLVSFTGDCLFFFSVNLCWSSSVKLANPPGGGPPRDTGDDVEESGDDLFDPTPRVDDFTGEDSPAILPATRGLLLSTVVTFFNFDPFWIWLNKAPLMSGAPAGFFNGLIADIGGGGGPIGAGGGGGGPGIFAIHKK